MGEYVGGSARIRFDYDAALRAARHVHELAVEVDGVRRRRALAGNEAATEWRGALVGEFDGRRSDDDSTLAALSVELRTGAERWALQWQHVMFENNKRARAQRVKQISDERSGLSKAWDWGPGSDDSDSKVAAAVCPPLPTPPGYWSTATPQRF
jgi:hypothetical protein